MSEKIRDSDEPTPERIAGVTDLRAWRDVWKASGLELPPLPDIFNELDEASFSGTADANSFVFPSAALAGFAEAFRDSRAVAQTTPVGRVSVEWLTDYLPAAEQAEQSNYQGNHTNTTPQNTPGDFTEWLVSRTGRGIERLTEGLNERFLRLQRPLAVFTPQQTDETILPETAVGSDRSVFASIYKRGGRLLLRLQSQNAALQNEIVAILLSQIADSQSGAGLFFVAMAATGVGNWSVGWAHISESERDAILPDAQMELQTVRFADHHVRLLPLLSLAAAEDAHDSADPLARSVWMDWMERWRQETQDASAS